MVTEIDRDELKQKLDHPKKFILVEALPPEHFRKQHLPGAINIPVEQIRNRAPELMPNKDMEVIVYCAGPACHASRQAADELTTMGYANVRHYAGGKEDWMQAGLPLVSGEKPLAA
jgi:rhodanese-related sulfurtransferase